MVELSQEQIQKLLSKWFRDELEKDEKFRIDRDPIDKDEAEWNAGIIMDIRERFISQLAISDYREISEDVDKLLANHKISIPTDSFTYKEIARNILKLQIQLYEIMAQREQGVYKDELLPPMPTGDTLLVFLSIVLTSSASR